MLELIQEDLTTLGYSLHNYNRYPTFRGHNPLNDYHDMFLDIYAESPEIADHGVLVDKGELFTNVGRLLHALLVKRTPPGRDYVYCEDAESKFYKAVMHRREPKQWRGEGPLVLITDGGKPVAVQKNIGESSILGLENRPQFNIYKDLLAAPLKHFYPKEVRLAPDKILQIPIEKFGAVTPGRIATSIFDPSLRQEMADSLPPTDRHHRNGLSFGNTEIVQAVKNLLPSAVPYSPSLLKDWTRTSGQRKLGF